jgi:hypothetical protein
MNFGDERRHLDIRAYGCTGVLQLPWELELELILTLGSLEVQMKVTTMQHNTP